MATPYTYRYSGQFRKYISQFLRIFSGIQVEYAVDRNNDGVNDRETVHVYYGDMTRITARILNKHDSFPSAKLPLVAGSLQNIEMNQENKKAPYHTDNVPYTQASTSTRRYIRRQMGVPYRMSMQLDIYASNTNQMFQIMEQILLLFNPRLTIQRSDEMVDWNYLTQVELTSIDNQVNDPLGTDRQIVTQSLSFEFDIMLDFPYEDSTNIIKEVITNVYDDTIIPDGIKADELDYYPQTGKFS